MTQMPTLIKFYVIDNITHEKMEVKTMKYFKFQMPATVRKSIRISDGGGGMKQGQWMLNGSYGGRWESITYFDTKEEAIKHGINLLKKYNHNTHDEKTRNQVMNDLTIYSYYNELIYTFFVGEIEEIAFPDETDSLLENIAERVYDVVGEYSEGYLDDVTEEHREELQNFIYRWAKQRGYLPECFLIGEIGEIDIRNFEEVSE